MSPGTLVEHYFKGGRSISDMMAEYRRAGEGLLPVYPRPLLQESIQHLRFELALRRGPQWRCNGCGWLPATSYTPTPPPCPHPSCKDKVPTMQRETRDPSTLYGHFQTEGRLRDWYLATAQRCGIPPLGTDDPEHTALMHFDKPTFEIPNSKFQIPNA